MEGAFGAMDVADANASGDGGAIASVADSSPDQDEDPFATASADDEVDPFAQGTSSSAHNMEGAFGAMDATSVGGGPLGAAQAVDLDTAFASDDDDDPFASSPGAAANAPAPVQAAGSMYPSGTTAFGSDDDDEDPFASSPGFVAPAPALAPAPAPAAAVQADGLDAAFGSNSDDDPFASSPGFGAPAVGQTLQAGSSMNPADVNAFESDDDDDDPFGSTPGQPPIPGDAMSFPVEQQIEDSLALPVLLHCHADGVWLTDRNDTEARHPYGFLRTPFLCPALVAPQFANLVRGCAASRADVAHLHLAGAVRGNQQLCWRGDARVQGRRRGRIASAGPPVRGRGGHGGGGAPELRCSLRRPRARRRIAASLLPSGVQSEHVSFPVGGAAWPPPRAAGTPAALASAIRGRVLQTQIYL